MRTNYHTILFFLLFIMMYMPDGLSFSITVMKDTIPVEKYLSGHNILAEKDKSGLYYRIDKKGTGAFPRKGDYVMLHYTGKLTSGEVFDKTAKEEPFVFQLGYGQVIAGWDAGIPLFNVGSTGTLFLPPALAFGEAGVGDIPPDAAIIFDIEVVDILTPEAYDRYMIDLEAREKLAFDKKMAEQFVADKKSINDYAAAHKIRITRTASGLSYAVTKKGKGPLPQDGDQVKVNFEGFLADGQKFDSSIDRDAPFTFTLGTGKVIAGWEEGIRFFNKGSEGWLLLPSRLGYGASPLYHTKVPVPENSILIFKIKVLEISVRE